MARPASKHPTELELEILKVLWRLGPLAATQVRDALARGEGSSKARDLALTSVITILNIMVRKRYLQRKKDGGVYLFRPRIEEKAIAKRMLGDLVERVFDGSAAAVVLSLLENENLDEQEIRHLRELISRKAKEPSR